MDLEFDSFNIQHIDFTCYINKEQLLGRTFFGYLIAKTVKYNISTNHKF